MTEPAEPLTERQADVLEFIAEFGRDRGWPPTRVEIGDGLGIAPNAVQGHVEALARKGYVHLACGTARGIKVLLDSSGEAAKRG